MKQKIIAVAGLVFLILFVLNISTIFYFYKQYNDNIGAINQQNALTKIKIEGLERDGESLKGAVDTLSASSKNYEQSFISLQDRLIMGEKGIREASDAVAGMKAGISDWQKKYDAAVSQIAALKKQLEALTNSLEEVKKVTTGSVNLGKISVQSDRTRSE